MASFGESIDPTAAISSILGTYPFSIGLLREILQNSDDAKAHSQIFLLDHRTHAKGQLLHEALGEAQGPALLAYNDATFLEEDWTALQRIHQSSKRTDTSKIGKYGIGFRSCYHITDSPQIISGNHLAVLDPQHAFNSDGGLKVEFTNNFEAYADHISAFNINQLVPSYVPGTALQGTIIRLPLRHIASRISSKTLSTDEIRRLLSEFVNKEMEMSLLFLTHLKSVVVLEINYDRLWRTGKVEIKKQQLACTMPHVRHYEVTVTALSKTQAWQLVEVGSPTATCAEILSHKLGYDVGQELKKEKLSPTIALAIPTPLEAWTLGRLFTYLPLPLPTNYPCHIHALFALTQARQNLWNCSETGLVKGTRDELLVVWNTTLFDTFIPRAWAAFLQLLTTSVDPFTCFHAWPPATQHASGGDPYYWQNVGEDVLHILALEQYLVWPVIGPTVSYMSARDVLVGREKDMKFISALGAAGVNVTVPPRKIQDMMRDGYQMLTPQNARSFIMMDVTPVLALNHTEKLLVLEYLLSTKDIRMLIGIFVVPLFSNDYTAIDAAIGAGRKHVILKGQEINLFGSLDEDAISLTQLPSSVQGLFIAPSASTHVNICLLSCAHALKYLKKAIESRAPDTMTNWLFRFWAWLVTWHEKDTLFASINFMSLLPDTDGHLRALSSTIFRLDGIDDSTRDVLSRLGISFLHPSFPQTALTYLETKEVVKSARSATALLAHLRPRLNHGLSPAELAVLCKHITSCLAHLRSLTNAEKARLRDLPIFSILSPGIVALPLSPSQQSQQPQGAAIQYGPLGGEVIHVVDVSTSRILALPAQGTLLLPIIPGMVFVSHKFQGLASTTLVSKSVGDRMPVDEMTIVEVFVTHLTTQPKRLQRAFLHCLVINSQAIPPGVLQTLKAVPFVPVGNGKSKLAAPFDVVDPKHKIAQLFELNDARLPRAVDPVAEDIIKYLRSLRLLRTTLTDEIVKERLKRIPKSASNKGIATHLLHILNDTRHDCSNLVEELALCWLPTPKGLRKPSQCRDDSTLCNRALFDLVLDVLDLREFALTSESLREGLGWNRSIALEVVKNQLDAETRGDASPSRLTLIIRELGSRVEEVEERGMKDELREITSRRLWIPVTGGELSTSARSLLCRDRAPPGFECVLHTLMDDEGAVRFLELMGCARRASNGAITEEIYAFGTQPLDPDSLKAVFELIGCLDTENLADDEHSSLLLPDKDSCLRPLHELYYDDLGSRAYELALPEDRCKVHDVLPFIFVSQLGIHTLSSLNLGHVDVDDEDMQEDLSTRISNVLRQYSIDQTFNEFLANASDATADQYNILLDKKPGKTDHILSPTMAQFQTCPSLIIHNNGVFTEDDFKGIRHVGLGGKQGRSDAIGKFGLGSLSMFHFTEMAMIVSGPFVMFLDPSKSYLPSNGRHSRSSLRIPLRNMWRIHTDHLNCLDGIQCFKADMEYYNGTLFRLPLRSDRQGSISKLSNDAVSAQTVADLIKSYGNVAPQSLLSISISSVTASKRDFDGSLEPFWSAKASRSDIAHGEAVPVCQQVEISLNVSGARQAESWHLVSQRAELSTLPEEFKPLTLKHKLRDITVTLMGLKSQGTVSQPKPPTCRLYSTLPLPTYITLPVHIDASFILADDRRSIRYDESGQLNLESRYNCWLLSDKVPALYTFLLETWPQKTNVHMWPGSTIQADDPISRRVVDSFYANHFAPSPRKFCLSMTGKKLSPAESIFLGTESVGVKKVIKSLKPQMFVKLSKQLRLKALVTGVKKVEPEALCDLIARNTAGFNTAWSKKEFEAEDLNSLLGRLLQGSSDALLGLPVLLLADDTLGTIKTTSDPPFFAIAAIRPSRWQPWPLFPAGRFVHRSINCRQLIDQEAFNVQDFSGDSAVSLIRDILPSGGTIRLNVSQQAWIRNFWEQFDGLGIDIKLVSSFPLVPTERGGEYVSLDQCHRPHVLAYRPSADELSWLGPVMKKLGATMILFTENYPAAMRREVKAIPSVLLDFENILSFLESLGHPWTQLYLTKVVAEDQRRFSSFCLWHIRSLFKLERIRIGRKKYKDDITVQHHAVVLQLPIWAARKEGRTVFVSAADPTLRMLPPGVTLVSASRFLERTMAYADHDDRLQVILRNESVTIQSLLNSLDIPQQLADDAIIENYGRLLEAVLSRCSQPGVIMKAYNTSGILVLVSTLYATTNPFFRTIFGDHSDRFPHRTLRGPLESCPRISGLNCVLDFSNFKECTRAVHFDTTAHSLARADAAYAHYNDNLWQTVLHDTHHWRQLDEFRFIPRDDVRRRYQNSAFAPEQYAAQLPAIVSPAQILRPELEAVAWTQRALARVAPSERLLLSNLEFGVPTAQEVVEHLRKLVMISDDHPNNPDVLSDLTETYRWLMTHRDDCQATLLACKNELLFLNVDDTASRWRFTPAQQILFNGHDEGNWRYARAFLMPFKELLLAVGAKEIKQAVRPALKLSPTVEVLVALRIELNKQREEQRLTDVVLQSTDEVKFPAHRAILAASAAHFKGMFDHEWREGAGLVQVEEHSNVLRQALDYIYLGSIEELDSQEVLLGLLELSDRWNLPELFKSVEHQLIPTISLGTHAELRKVGTTYRATMLIAACDRFRIDNAHAL